MEQITVIYDACVLYPSLLRSLLMYLVMAGLFRARWTDQIHEEWMRNVLKNHPDITRRQVERIRDLMNAHVEDCLVNGYESLVNNLKLPDPTDRHVLAAAIVSRSNLILTFNLADFPVKTLAAHGIVARHPDQFVSSLVENDSHITCYAVRKHRLSMKNPSMTVEQYLNALRSQSLIQSARRLMQHSELL